MTMKLLKIYNILQDIYENGNPNKYHLTMSDADIILDIYNTVSSGGKGKTISKYVADFFKKYGMNVEDEGIGWIIGLED